MTVCLLIHGFTGGEHEVAPLADYLRQHGCTARTFTLKGLTGTREEMLAAGRRDWISRAEEELAGLLAQHSTVHLIGFSTGALIAVHLAAKYGERIGRLILLSTPVFPLNPREIMKTLLRAEMLKAYIRNAIKTPPWATREYYRLVRETFEIYGQVRQPALIVQGTNDHLVRDRSASYLVAHLGSPDKKLLMIENSGHLVCHCSEKELLFREALDWICNP
ncbi:alpha/beta hydrolase [Paenibacillus jiagnxiensis]|uniref:alpha/beta hydrolase n=1 Tax=Paenibacillus jiagnxiensis TaxID=3228926 RepID=UPI0033A6A0D4